MGNEIKISDLTEKLQAFAKKADQDSVEGNKNDKLDSEIELSVFRGYVNDAEAKKMLDAEDKANLKSVMGYTPVPFSMDDAVAKAQNKEDASVAQIFGYTQTAQTTTAGEVKAVPNKYSTVLTEYTKLRQAGKGPYEAYKAVEERYEDKDEYESALKELKVKAKHIDAQIETIGAIGESETTESSKQVKRDAKATLAQQDGGKIDKWHKRAVNGNNNFVTWASGEDSAMKEVRKGQLYENRAEKIKKDGVTMDAIVDRLGENCPYLQKVEKDGKQVTLLEAAGFMKQRKDGRYDISVLSDFVKANGTGADNTQSRQENKAVREKELLLAEMNTKIKQETGFDLSKTRVKDKYSKRLVKLTGRHVEKKNIIQPAYANTVGGALAGGLGTLAALFFSGKDIVKGVVTNKNHLDFTLELDGFSNIQSSLDSLTNDPEIQKMLQEGTASITTTGTKVNIVIDQTKTQPFMHAASKHLERAIKGAAVGAAIGLLSSALSYGKSEQEVIPNKTDCKTYDEYVTYIDSLVTNKAVKPLYGEIAKQVALSFTDKDGNMDCNGMNKFLGFEASNGSRLNRAELMRALIDRQKELNKPQPPKVEEKKEKPQYTGEERTIEGEVIKTAAPKTDRFEDWGVFASRYKCIEDYDENFKINEKAKDANLYARTMMKVMQAIEDDNYDLDRLQNLTAKAMSKNWRAELSKEPGFNLDKYAALRGNKKNHRFAMDRQNMPTITIVNGENVRTDACPPSKKPLYKLGKQSGGKGTKVNLGDAHNTRKGEDRYEGSLRTSTGEYIPALTHEVYVSEKNNLAKTHEWVDPKKAKFNK